MNIISNNCTTITIDSSWFVLFNQEYPNNTFTLELQIENHLGQITNEELEREDFDNLNGSIVTKELPQGVYHFTIIKLNDDDSFEKDTQCYFNECDLACEIADKLSEGCLTTHRFYTFLKAINLCNTCSCKYAFIAYNKLSNLLIKPIIKENINECGCN